MSFIVKLRDKTEIIVPNEAGEALMEYLLRLKSPENIEIAGQLYRSSEIISVIKANLDERIEKPSSAPQLSEPKYNCAPYSIQRTIMMWAIKNNRVKDLKSESFREQMRSKLRSQYPHRKWCDHRANEHACLDKETADAR